MSQLLTGIREEAWRSEGKVTMENVLALLGAIGILYWGRWERRRWSGRFLPRGRGDSHGDDAGRDVEKS